MRVAVIAGSLSAGVRIAEEVQRVANVDASIVLCNLKARSSMLRWGRELLLALKSHAWTSLPFVALSYARSGKLRILNRALDDPASLDVLRSLQCDVGLHAANVIYRESTISAFRLGVLNAHIGILPAYRGRSVAEWSILQGDSTGITVFFIDSGIDTGERIVLREFISPNGSKNVAKLKNMLFECDARMYRQALEVLMSANPQFECNDVSKGRRYYVMSRLFTDVADRLLSSRTEAIVKEPTVAESRRHPG